MFITSKSYLLWHTHTHTYTYTTHFINYIYTNTYRNCTVKSLQIDFNFFFSHSLSFSLFFLFYIVVFIVVLFLFSLVFALHCTRVVLMEGRTYVRLYVSGYAWCEGADTNRKNFVCKKKSTKKKREIVGTSTIKLFCKLSEQH